jgi:hypothetical protein
LSGTDSGLAGIFVADSRRICFRSVVRKFSSPGDSDIASCKICWIID